MKKDNKRLKRSLSRFQEWLQTGDNLVMTEMGYALEDPDQVIADDQPISFMPREDFTERGRKRDGHWARLYEKLYPFMGVGVCLIMVVVLLSLVGQLPQFAEPETLMDGELSTFYAERTLEETGAVNIVTGIILDFRGFDTLGETHVLFIALCTVLILLRAQTRNASLDMERADQQYEPKSDPILLQVVRFLTPCIGMFGLYGLLNGHLSPGGGFSGGAILGAGLILFQNAFGFSRTERFMNQRSFSVVVVLALAFYVLSKGYHFVTGANGWPTFLAIGDVGNLFSAKLLPYLSVAVGSVVACVMYAMYALFRKGDL